MTFRLFYLFWAADGWILREIEVETHPAWMKACAHIELGTLQAFHPFTDPVNREVL